ncbi:Ubiquitin-conjugating enzyme E2 32 [Mortierella sp. AD032]|nr:Ubiquitin-conjugating enzyme E2 32 [Mortierella sp. AD032]
MASLAGIPAQYNKKSSAVKRIMQEARELMREPSTDFAANPLETDIFEWHFTIRGPEETEFEGGLYHGRILLPNNYPFAPPSLMFMTPNGRFELHKKVCLSITGYHPEYWQPAWGIRTVLVAVMGFLPTQSKGAIGGLDTSVEARKALAIK